MDNLEADTVVEGVVEAVVGVHMAFVLDIDVVVVAFASTGIVVPCKEHFVVDFVVFDQIHFFALVFLVSKEFYANIHNLYHIQDFLLLPNYC